MLSCYLLKGQQGVWNSQYFVSKIESFSLHEKVGCHFRAIKKFQHQLRGLLQFLQTGCPTLFRSLSITFSTPIRKPNRPLDLAFISDENQFINLSQPYNVYLQNSGEQFPMKIPVCQFQGLTVPKLHPKKLRRCYSRFPSICEER